MLDEDEWLASCPGYFPSIGKSISPAPTE